MIFSFRALVVIPSFSLVCLLTVRLLCNSAQLALLAIGDHAARVGASSPLPDPALSPPVAVRAARGLLLGRWLSGGLSAEVVDVIPAVEAAPGGEGAGASPSGTLASGGFAGRRTLLDFGVLCERFELERAVVPEDVGVVGWYRTGGPLEAVADDWGVHSQVASAIRDGGALSCSAAAGGREGVESADAASASAGDEGADIASSSAGAAFRVPFFVSVSVPPHVSRRVWTKEAAGGATHSSSRSAKTRVDVLDGRKSSSPSALRPSSFGAATSASPSTLALPLLLPETDPGYASSLAPALVVRVPARTSAGGSAFSSTDSSLHAPGLPWEVVGWRVDASGGERVACEESARRPGVRCDAASMAASLATPPLGLVAARSALEDARPLAVLVRDVRTVCEALRSHPDDLELLARAKGLVVRLRGLVPGEAEERLSGGARPDLPASSASAGLSGLVAAVAALGSGFARLVAARERSVADREREAHGVAELARPEPEAPAA